MLKVESISFGYSAQKKVLKSFSFRLEKGEHLCVMGESGSGKSTLLKAIYGLIDLNLGSIYWNEIQVFGPKKHLVPGMHFFKYVAQDFDLMPYTSVSENIQKFLSRFYLEEAQKRTHELLEVIEMSEFANTKVKNLSGGQKQRVAIARALAKEPELILLDEPFSQIDNFKKNSLRRRLFSYLKTKNIACIEATHDGDDALSFADKLIVIKDNQILVNNSPKEIYKNPKDIYVASLFDDVNEVFIYGGKHFFYPHQIQLSQSSPFKAQVLKSYFKGFYWLIEAEFDGKKLFFQSTKEVPSGDLVNLDFPSVPKK